MYSQLLWYVCFCISGCQCFAVLFLLYFAVFTVSYDCVNYVQCVKYPVSRLVCCLSLCGCDTPPPTGCCFSIKITLKAASLYLSCGSTLEGTQFQSAVEGAQPARSVVSPKIGPSAWTEHPWTTAVTPWEKRPVAPVANWRVLSRISSIKEILVTIRQCNRLQWTMYSQTQLNIFANCQDIVYVNIDTIMRISNPIKIEKKVIGWCWRSGSSNVWYLLVMTTKPISPIRLKILFLKLRFL